MKLYGEQSSKLFDVTRFDRATTGCSDTATKHVTNFEIVQPLFLALSVVSECIIKCEKNQLLFYGCLKSSEIRAYTVACCFVCKPM